MREVERKFLVTSEQFKAQAFGHVRIVQGFLSRDPERTVRVRIKGESGFLTIKGKSQDGGVSRFEWEKEIPVKEAHELLKICVSGTIDKIRFFVDSGDHVFEIDEFHGENHGLVVAEVELGTVNEKFRRPGWLGQEVTGLNRYYNSQLSNNPYKNWKNNTNENVN